MFAVPPFQKTATSETCIAMFACVSLRLETPGESNDRCALWIGDIQPCAHPTTWLTLHHHFPDQSKVATCCKLRQQGTPPDPGVCHYRKSTDEPTSNHHMKRDQIPSLSASMSKPATSSLFQTHTGQIICVSCSLQNAEGQTRAGQPSQPPNQTPPALPKPPPESARPLERQRQQRECANAARSITVIFQQFKSYGRRNRDRQ